MKWIISFLLLISINSFAQEIKYAEVVSEIQDSMVLLNKQDVDSINKMFHEYAILDSLNIVNEEIIFNLIEKHSVLDSILLEQRTIIVNDSIIMCKNKLACEEEINYYKKEIRKQSNRKIFYQSTTGISLLALLLILLI